MWSGVSGVVFGMCPGIASHAVFGRARHGETDTSSIPFRRRAKLAQAPCAF